VYSPVDSDHNTAEKDEKTLPELSLPHKVARVPLIFEANIIQEVRIHYDRLIEPDGPGRRVSLGIVHRNFDLQMAEIRAAEFFRDRASLGERTPS
jgi:hypothetical protein